MLSWRLFLGTCFVVSLAGLCWLDEHATITGTWLLPLALLLAFGISRDLIGLWSARKVVPDPWVVYVGNLLIVGSNGLALLWGEGRPLSPGWPLGGLAVGLLLALGRRVWCYEKPGTATLTVGLHILALVYVGILLSFVVQLRFVAQPPWGMLALLSLIMVVKMGDIGAYTCGRLLGRHKMAPVLSPGKTWEGAAGYLVLACLGAYLALRVFPTLWGNWAVASAQVSGPHWLTYGLIVGAAGMLGDLVGSLFKRDARQKDSSNWLPGFGGILDLLDSILLAAPVAYALWASRFLGP